MHVLEPGTAVTDPLAPYRAVDRRTTAGACWVLANMVGGIDGSAAIGGRVGELSSPTDAELFRLLRAVADVVLVGAETVRRERYGPARLPDAHRAERTAAGRTPVPPIAVVSRSLDLDWSSPLFTAGDPSAPPLVLTCAAADPARQDEARRHAAVIVAGDDRVEPSRALAALAERGASTVLCEGGPTLLGELAAADLLDELCLTIEPLLGGDPLPVAVAPAAGGVVRLHLAHVLRADDTLFLRYERRSGGRREGGI